MSTTHQMPAPEYLNECFLYNPVNGDLIWKQRPMNHFSSVRAWRKFNVQFAGTVAGTRKLNNTQRPTEISVGLCVYGDKTRFSAHQIICRMLGIRIPDGYEVDHRDGNPFNNSITNIRVATRSKNQANRRRNRNRVHNYPKGVWKNGNGYTAQIGFNGIKIRLGTYDTPEQAQEAYYNKAVELFGEFAKKD